MHIRLPEFLWVRLRAYMFETKESKQEAVRALLKLGLDEYAKRRSQPEEV